MLKPIFRYGIVLGILLGLFEFLRHANALRLLSQEVYLGIIAAFFLVGGFVLAWTMVKGNISPAPKRGPAEISDPIELSSREQDVLTYLAHGYTNAEIAKALGVTQNTVKTHVKNLFSKLGVSNRTEAASEAKIMGILK